MKENTKLTFKFFWGYVKRHKKLALLGFAAITLAILSDMYFYILFRDFVDALTNGADRNALLWIIFWIFLSQLFSSSMWRTSGYAASIFESQSMKEIVNHCFGVLHLHSYNFFNNQFVGSLVKRISRMAGSFENIIDQSIFEFYPLVLRTVTAIIVLYWMSPWLGLALLIWSVIFVFIHFKISRYAMRRYDIPKAAADSRTIGYLADTVTNNSNIKLFANLDFEKKNFEKVSGDWVSILRSAWIFRNHMDAVQGIMMVFIHILILYEGLVLWEEGRLTVGDFVLIQTYLVSVFMHLWDFGRLIRRFYESLADAEEMTIILNTPIEVVNKRGAKKLVMRRGAVEFEHVSFSYTEEEESSILRNFSFKVKPGERIALIGPSGGGKTTIVKLLLRLFDLDKGKILMDGQDISQVTQESLRKEIALVPQDPILFHRSLMENIRYGNIEAGDKEVMVAAKLAHCHEFISHFPEGYNTFVGERGVKLSGGERQRVAIARAILANTKILILDEATSSLDSESEKLIKDALNNLMKSKTVFVIAHRLSTIVDMDRILVLEKGRIVEEGSHSDLVAKKGGLYKRLWDLQMGGYLA